MLPSWPRPVANRSKLATPGGVLAIMKVTTGTLLLVVAAVVTVRCARGAVGDQPVRAVPLLLGVGLFSGLAMLVAPATTASGVPSRYQPLQLWLPRLATAILLVGLLVSRLPIELRLASLLVPLLGEGLALGWRKTRQPPVSDASEFEPLGQVITEPARSVPESMSITEQSDDVECEIGVDEEELECAPGLDEVTDQRITRACQTPDGDVLHALLRCRLEPSQRLASVHIGFCPPFRAVPEITLRAVDGPDARVTLGENLAWGARIDVRLQQPCESATSCVLELVAHVAPRDQSVDEGD